jgi:hypothetical protein
MLTAGPPLATMNLKSTVESQKEIPNACITTSYRVKTAKNHFMVVGAAGALEVSLLLQTLCGSISRQEKKSILDKMSEFWANIGRLIH